MAGNDGGDAPKTVLVTGGSGYLAAWVIAGLLGRGHRVRTTIRDIGKAERVREAVAERTGNEAAASIEFTVADLLADRGWDQAMSGADYVIHTASPLGFTPGEDLVRTAREGVRRVLGAAARAGVARVVLTSSGSVAVPTDPAHVANETVWAEPKGTKTSLYNDSKILAERDAWDLAATTGLDLVTVLPTFMQGPPLGIPGREGSIEILRRLLVGGVPAIPHIGWDLVDVRDAAELHILAMTNPDATGQRLIGAGGWLWWQDMAHILREQLPEAVAARIPTRTMPSVVVKLLAPFNVQLKMLRENLDRHTVVDASKAHELLHWRARPVEQTILETANALLAKGAA